MRTGLALLALSLALAGCNGDDDGEPRPIEGAAKEVATVIERLERATAARDFETVCEDLFATATRARAGGAGCARALAARARGVRRPRIVVEAIAVEGRQAEARVRTTARGQAAVTDVIRLVRERGRFRIAALG